MKFLSITAALCAVAPPVAADGHYSNLLADIGPTRAAEALATQTTFSPSDHMALGGLRFLSAVEQALQSRYTYGLSSRELSLTLDLPFLRLTVLDNPSPKSKPATLIEDIFTSSIATLATANDALDQVLDNDAVSVRIDLGDIWFDINGNSRRDPGEDGMIVLADALGEFPNPESDAPVIEFDAADAAWLSAYAHMISGISELVLSTNPSEAFATVFEGARRIDETRSGPLNQTMFLGQDEIPALDLFATVVRAIEGPVDPVRSRAARQHILDGLGDNRVFWSRLRAETDNQDEWIPNDDQTSALPLTFPQGLGDSWEAVLDDVEAVLRGELLIPHWRLGQAAGIDLGQLLQSPPEIDIVGLFQGFTLAPYAKPGKLITFERMEAFDEMTNGNSPLFAIILN